MPEQNNVISQEISMGLEGLADALGVLEELVPGKKVEILAEVTDILSKSEKATSIVLENRNDPDGKNKIIASVAGLVVGEIIYDQLCAFLYYNQNTLEERIGTLL